MATKESNHFAILLVGEDGAGKTAIADRFINDRFTGVYDPTIEGKHVYSKQCIVDKELALIKLLDPGTQEDYRVRNFWDLRMREQEGVVLVYSVTSSDTFHEIRKLYREVLRISEQNPFPMVLVANRCEAELQRQVGQAEGEELAKEIGCTFFEASAKTGKNINEAFHQLVREIRKHRRATAPVNASQSDIQHHDSGCCSACVVL